MVEMQQVRLCKWLVLTLGYSDIFFIRNYLHTSMYYIDQISLYHCGLLTRVRYYLFTFENHHIISYDL